MLPHASAALGFRAGDLLATELIEAFPTIEVEPGFLAVVAFEG